MEGTSHETRFSTYSLSNEQHTPEWLEEPFDLDEVIRPPSYLVASLQQALSESPYDLHPPAYEHAVPSPNAAAGPSRYRYPSPRRVERTIEEHESIWEDSDESDGADDADDELERSAYGDADGSDKASRRGLADSDGGSTLLDVACQEPSPAFSPSNQERPPDHVQQEGGSRIRSPSPPPSYHLYHVHNLMENIAKVGVDPHTSLVPCLAGLDAQLLAHPFAAFAEVCYQAAIRGDDSPPTDRPFSPPPPARNVPLSRPPTKSPPPQPVASGSNSGSHSASASGSSSQASSSSRALAHALRNENVDNMDLCPPLADGSDGEDDEAEEPRSPLATFMAPPLVYDGRPDENSRPRGGELPFSDNIRCMSPVSMSLMFASEEPPGNKSTYRPSRSTSDPAAEVACLFLSAPIPTSAGAAVQCFPTRPPPTQRAGGSGMRNMLYRSFNINRM